MEKNLRDYDKDLFIKQLTYLPFKDVIALCQSNTKFHDYCTNNNYNNSWKKLIDDTFSDITNYEDKLNKIWLDKGINPGVYNYIIYTNLVNYLDPITQLMIYYKQKDMESFENKSFDRNDKVYRFLALFLLHNQEIIYNYLPNDAYLPFVDLLNGIQVKKKLLNRMLLEMILRGNLLGVKLLQSKGADIHDDDDEPFRWASQYGHLDIVIYLIENGADIHAINDWGFREASERGHLDIVKYLLEKGANIRALNNSALIWSSANGHLNVVRYLIENGANIHANDDEAVRMASYSRHLKVVKYLVENGADIHADDDFPIKIANQRGHKDIVEYIQSLN